MKRKLLSASVATALISLISVAILAVSCSNKSTNPPEPASVSTLTDIRASDNSIAGWTEDTTRYLFFSDSQSAHIVIDGGFDRYIQNNVMPSGFRAFIDNNSDTANLKELDWIIMDFGTSANATTMYNKTLALGSEFDPSVKYAVPGFDASTADGNQKGGGITVWAHFKQFYFKLALTGYPDSEIATAANQAASFLTAFKSSIK